MSDTPQINDHEPIGIGEVNVVGPVEQEGELTEQLRPWVVLAGRWLVGKRRRGRGESGPPVARGLEPWRHEMAELADPLLPAVHPLVKGLPDRVDRFAQVL